MSISVLRRASRCWSIEGRLCSWISPHGSCPRTAPIPAPGLSPRPAPHPAPWPSARRRPRRGWPGSAAHWSQRNASCRSFGRRPPSACHPASSRGLTSCARAAPASIGSSTAAAMETRRIGFMVCLPGLAGGRPRSSCRRVLPRGKSDARAARGGLSCVGSDSGVEAQGVTQDARPIDPIRRHPPAVPAGHRAAPDALRATRGRQRASRAACRSARPSRRG